MLSPVQLMLVAYLFYALMQICVKQLSDFPTAQVVFFRGFFALIFCLSQMKIQNIRPILGTERGLLIIRGLSGTVALALFFYTLQRIPMASAVTLQHSSPIFTAILAVFINKEKNHPLNWLALMIAFIGVFIVQGSDVRIPLSIAIIGTCSALLSGVAYNCIRRIGSREHPSVIILYFALMIVPCTLPFTIMYWKTPNLVEWLYFLGIGVSTQAAHLCLTSAYQRGKASELSIYANLGTVYALIIGFVIFGEKYPMISLLGLALIVAATLLSKKAQKLSSS